MKVKCYGCGVVEDQDVRLRIGPDSSVSILQFDEWKGRALLICAKCGKPFKILNKPFNNIEERRIR